LCDGCCRDAIKWASVAIIGAALHLPPPPLPRLNPPPPPAAIEFPPPPPPPRLNPPAAWSAISTAASAAIESSTTAAGPWFVRSNTVHNDVPSMKFTSVQRFIAMTDSSVSAISTNANPLIYRFHGQSSVYTSHFANFSKRI
jgi:hypothetical protein